MSWLVTLILVDGPAALPPELVKPMVDALGNLVAWLLTTAAGTGALAWGVTAFVRSRKEAPEAEKKDASRKRLERIEAMVERLSADQARLSEGQAKLAAAVEGLGRSAEIVAKAGERQSELLERQSEVLGAMHIDSIKSHAAILAEIKAQGD